MELKALEIKGFKSFADKTAINFNKNVTGVVGPNGCGKSNVIDAIRWVLGEQKTKKLRSDKMDNLIFNGTKSRKSAGLAEVSLTLDNTKNVLPIDYNTLKVTRILHRSGESEYRLNDVNCRLKDITNLFLDTGITTDSYSIIELKMIEEILNDQDNSRKRLFDNAAGISKYKTRKRETFNKLKNTEADLERVEDLLHEIEGNMKMYEKQAKRASRYKELKTEYKELAIDLSLIKMSSFKESFKHLETRETELSDIKLKADTEIKKLEAAIEQEKTGLIDKEKSLSDLQKKLNEHISLLSSKENEKNLLNEGLKFSREKKMTLVDDLSSGDKKIAELKKSEADLKDNIDLKEASINHHQQKLEELSERKEKASDAYNESYELLNKVREEKNAQDVIIIELEKKIAINNSQKENFNKELEEYSSRAGSRQKELEEMKSNLAEMESQRSTAREVLSGLEGNEKNLNEELEKLERQIESLKENLAEEQRKIDATQNQISLTKSLIDNLEGFPEAVKFLSKNKSWAKNAPLLSDIISTNQDYKVAIENYLEQYLSYYIVDNVDEAITAINLLSDAAKGRANFFILDQLPTSNLNQFSPTDGSKAATDIVTYDTKYKNLIAFLLQDVYIIDDVSQTVNYADFELKSGKKFITSSGKFSSSRFSVSGGSIGLFEGNRIGRAQNLKKLIKEVEVLESKAEKINEQLKLIVERAEEIKAKNIRSEIDAKRESLNELENRYISISTRIENIEQFLKDSEDKGTSLTGQMDFVSKQNSKNGMELASLMEIAGNINARIESNDQTFQQLSSDLEIARNAFNEQNILLINEKSQLDNLKHELTIKSDLSRQESERLISNKDILTELDKNISDMESQIQTDDSGLLSLYDKKGSYEQALKEAEEKYYEDRKDIDKYEVQLRGETRKRNETDAQLTQTKDKFNELKMSAVSVKERLNLEFGLEMDDILEQEPKTELTVVDLQAKVDKLKKRLDNYGEVNPLAIDAYEEIKTRFDFIIEQKTDLLGSKDALLNTIEEIELKATGKFMEAFDLIKNNFQMVFRSLFTEDDFCDLKLIDPENPLESKIDIIAKPKGKRPLTINQLSGGEKTLTALSLLFGLYLLKPAPFCILDEVDAPLDDANINKFNNIIRKFSGESQFIIVTHNKLTMSTVDNIYGVTMAETGISTVVPVDFSTLN